LTDLLRCQVADQSSPFYAFYNYCQTDRVVRQHGHQPRRILELGPGSNVGTLFCFVAGGAERAVGVDIQPMERPPEFYRILKDYLACVEASQWWWRPSYPCAWEDIDSQTLQERVEYFAPVSAHDLPFTEGEFDLVYSNAAMEHFDRPRDVVRQIHRVLSPGGLTIHHIDLSSHGFGDGHLSHLLLGREEYDCMAQKYGDGRGIDQRLQGKWKGVVYLNRLRAPDWKQLFLEAGMNVLSLDVLGKLDPATIDPLKLAEPFCNRSREELAPEIIRVVAQKPR